MLGVHLWLWQDMNNDGAAELVMSDSLCGAHTCFDNFKILSWNGIEFINRLADRTDRTDDLPNPRGEISDPDGDGIYDFVVQSGGISSVGAGPQRGKIRVWTYDSAQGVWMFASDTPGESNFRLHILHDADVAATRGDYDTALTLYDRVVNDDTLQDWIDPPTERENLTAFAMYREVMIHLLRGNTGATEATLTQMRNRFPPESTQTGYVDMALLFHATYPTGLETTCAAVRDFATLHASTVLEPLGSIVFGYGNPDYTAGQMCFGQ